MVMKKYISELIGTFGLVFCGTGAIIVNDLTGGVVSHVGIALTFGLIIMTMIYAFGEVSGAHINPAVTFGFWLSGRFPAKEVMPYILAQLCGAFLASGMLKLFFPIHDNLGTTMPSGSVLQTFMLEIVLTFFLMLVIIKVATGSKETGIMAGFAIGATVLLEALFAGPISGASMNPARSIAPALLSGQLDHFWIYLTAPPIGAALAIVIHNLTKPSG
jgi:aquaporin Z